MPTRLLRWLIVFMIFIATGLSFLDRQVLSVAILKIQKELSVSDTQYGLINTAFLVSYALMFTVAGRVIDRVGSKKGLAFSVGIWSVASCLHGFVQNFSQLFAFRFLLGLGEGGCFPGAAKAVNEWFDRKNRALANGIAIGGSAVGAVVAPPLTTYITNSGGWRLSFVIPGIAGIVWVISWLLIRKPSAATDDASEKKSLLPFSSLLRSGTVWLFIVIRFLLDPVFYFIVFWVPKYLSESRGASFENIGSLFWIPFFTLGISNIVGGWFSDSLTKQNISFLNSRKIVMGFAAALTIVAPFIASVSTIGMVIFLLSVLTFAHGFWITNYITLIADFFGARGTSTVIGLAGTAGAISALIINPMIGNIIAKYSYLPLWIASGCMYPLAFILLLLFLPKIKTLAIKKAIG